MKKPKSQEMETLRQTRESSPNPDLAMSNSYARCEEYDLTPERRVVGYVPLELSFKVPKPGNCVRKDGKE